MKTKLTHFRFMKEKQHQSSPPLAPLFQGGEASLEPENNGATFTSFLLAKVKGFVEVSTLGKALNKKPRANKSSPCAFKLHIHTLPNLQHCCLLAALGTFTPCCANPWPHWHGGLFASAGPCAPHAWRGRSKGLVFLSRGLPLSPSLPTSPVLPNVQDTRQRPRHCRQLLSKIRNTD